MFSGKIFTADKNFKRLPVAAVAKNFKSVGKWYILNIYLCPSFPLSYDKYIILLTTSFIRQHDLRFSSQRARSWPWWEGSRPWDSCWSSCWKFSAPRPGKEAPPVTKHLKRDRQSHICEEKKPACISWTWLPCLLSWGGGCRAQSLKLCAFRPHLV